MKQIVIDSLWDKMKDVFVSKTQYSQGLNTKQNTLIQGNGISIINDEISLSTAAPEYVVIQLNTNVQEVSVAGKDIQIYYNDNENPEVITTDSNGTASIIVPYGYTYRIVFPDIQGCVTPSSITHIASVFQRSIEVIYKDVTAFSEVVNIHVGLIENDVSSPLADVQIGIKIGNRTTQYSTDNDGNIQLSMLYGTVYTVIAPELEGKYLRTYEQQQQFTAEKSFRGVVFNYRTYSNGLFIVDSQNNEYKINEWEEAIEQGTVQTSDAKLIKVATANLVANSGVFYLEIDSLATRTYQNKSWASQNLQFYDIPLNGNSSTADYYYDGAQASKLIQKEGNNRAIETPAVDLALSLSTSVGNITLNGFLGSVGQWSQLWVNRVEIDLILASTRPEATYNFSTFTANKWTSTQGSATRAWRWTSAADDNVSKNGSYGVVPFFA